jgi:hypothetical protein
MPAAAETNNCRATGNYLKLQLRPDLVVNEVFSPFTNPTAGGNLAPAYPGAGSTVSDMVTNLAAVPAAASRTTSYLGGSA